MDPNNELELLKAIEEQDRNCGLIVLARTVGSSQCYILGQAETLASQKLDFEIKEGVKHFEADEVKSLFTGIIICREIYSSTLTDNSNKGQ